MSSTPESMAANLRRLAEFIESEPDQFEKFRYAFHQINVFVDNQQDMAVFARAGLKHRATVEKDGSDDWFTVKLHFGEVVVHVNAHRDQVCERVVVGTETVTKTVKDPEALAAVPDIEVTEEVERFEWKCRPLLAEDGAA
jgi:hypothetical protein